MLETNTELQYVHAHTQHTVARTLTAATHTQSRAYTHCIHTLQQHTHTAACAYTHQQGSSAHTQQQGTHSSGAHVHASSTSCSYAAF